MKQPKNIKLVDVLSSGGETISEELVDAQIDGGFWNTYAQTYRTPTGTEYVFECQGEEMGDVRDAHECIEIIHKP